MGKHKQVSFEHFRSSVEDAVRYTGSQFTEPGEDWEPVLLMAGRKGISLITHSVEAMRTPDFARVFLPRELRKVDAYMVASVASMWMAKLSPSDYPPGVDPASPFNEKLLHEVYRGGVNVRPSTMANREEGVFIAVVSPWEKRVGLALISRTDDAPPTLGAFDWTFHKFEARALESVRGVLLELEAKYR